MKINNKVFICTLLVLIIFFSINACSAEETLDESLGADACGEISVSETPIDELSDRIHDNTTVGRVKCN